MAVRPPSALTPRGCVHFRAPVRTGNGSDTAAIAEQVEAELCRVSGASFTQFVLIFVKRRGGSASRTAMPNLDSDLAIAGRRSLQSHRQVRTWTALEGSAHQSNVHFPSPQTEADRS